MFDQKTLKAAKIGQIALAVNIVVFLFIGISLGKSDEDGWFGMTGMFAFSFFSIIPFLMLVIAVNFDTCLIHIENQISKKLGTEFTFMKEASNQSKIKRATRMFFGILGCFLMLLFPAFLFGFGIVFSVSQRNFFWIVIGVYVCLIVSIAYITAILTILVRVRLKRMERFISECNLDQFQKD